MQYRVDYHGNGIGQVTDGKQTYFLTKGVHYFNELVTNQDGHLATITNLNPEQNDNVFVLEDAPIVEDNNLLSLDGSQDGASKTKSKKIINNNE